MARERYYRRGTDPGPSKVRNWIEKWYGDSGDLQIGDFSISTPSPTDISKMKSSKTYQSAFQKNQSKLHSFLKFVAYNWLSTTSNSQPQYEQQMYLPIDELLQDVKVVGGTFDPCLPQLIEKGRRDVYAMFGVMMSVDVFCDRTSVEVGYTQPFNICMPLIEDLAEYVVWIHFPKAINATDFEPNQHEIGSVHAYKFSIIPT